MAWTVKIDNVALTDPPGHVIVEEPQPVAIPTAGYGKVVYLPRTPGRVQLVWGDEHAVPAVVAELRNKRAGIPQHMLTWTKETGTGQYRRNIIIPLIGYGQSPGALIDTFTLVLEEYRPIPIPMYKELHVPGTLATGDGQFRWVTPAGGRIIHAEQGFIRERGTVSGQTRIQIRNSTLAFDYLSTRGDFTFGGGTTNMTNAVLSTSSPGSSLPAGGFNRGDVINLDIDTIPGGADSADVSIWLVVLLYPV